MQVIQKIIPDIFKFLLITVVGSILFASLLSLIHWFAYCKDNYESQLILQGFEFCFGWIALYFQVHLTLPGIDFVRQLFAAMMCH